MSIFYGVAFILSAILLIANFLINKKREKWLSALFVAILVCNLGYFLLSLSTNLTMALISNSIAYLGNVFLPFFMLMLILNACGFKENKILKYVLLGVGVVILFFATSGGYLPIYYKSVSLEIIEGGARLVKEYGPLHYSYFAYLFAYMLSMVVIIVYSIIKKKTASKMHAIFLSVVVFGNILVWLIEQFVAHNFEFLCISYVLNECLLLLLYGILQENNKKHAVSSGDVDLTILDLKEGLTAEQVALVFANWEQLNELTKREKEIVKHILLGEKRKEIAQTLFISDSAVRNHTTSIFKKLEVSKRNELYEKAKSYIN